MTACSTSASSANRLPGRLVLGSPERWNWAPHSQTDWEVINSPPYSPFVVPSDVHPIAPLKMRMAGKRLIADADVKQSVTLRLQTHDDFFSAPGYKPWCRGGTAAYVDTDSLLYPCALYKLKSA